MSSVLRTRAIRLFPVAALLAHATAARGSTLALSEAVSRALASGPDAMIAKLEAERAGDSLSQARGAYLPNVGITSHAGYSNRLDEKLRAVDARGVEHTYPLSSLGSDRGWLNVFLRQQLLDLRSWHEISRTELEVEVAQLAEREQREGIALAVFQAYVDVLRQQRMVDLDRDILSRAERLDAQAATLLGAGRSLPSEREQVAIHLKEIGVDAEIRRTGLAQARSLLAVLTGLDAGESGDLEADGASIPAPATAGEGADAEAALADSPELRILDLRERAEEIGVSAARAGRYPTVALNAGYSHYGAKRYDLYEDELVVGLDVEIPIFDGLRTHYAVSAASKDAEIARLRYHQMLERKKARVRELADRMHAAQNRPALAHQRQQVAGERMRLADLSLQTERGTFDAALQARRDYADAAAAAIDADLDGAVAWATLRREKGLLTAAILGESAAAAR